MFRINHCFSNCFAHCRYFSVVSGKSPSGNACVAEALTTSLEVDSDAALVFEPSSELPPFKYASMSSFVIRPFYQNHLQL